MITIFWTLMVLYGAFACLSFARNHNLVSPHFLIPIFFCLPCCVYFCGFSELVATTCCDDFYSTIIAFLAILLFDLLWFSQKMEIIKKRRLRMAHSVLFVDAATTAYFVIYFIENYIASGSFFPLNEEVDIHTVSITGFSIITHALFVFVAINLFTYSITKKMRFAFYAVMIIFGPFFMRSARLNTAICLVQVGLLGVLYYRSKNVKTIVKSGHWLKMVVKSTIVLLMGCALVVGGALFTNIRMSREAGREESYHAVSQSTISTGCEVADEVFAFLYGYLSFSFDNLQNAIEEMPSEKHNYWGKHSFKPLTYGLLRLHNICGFPTYEPGTFSAECSKDFHGGGFATVPTMLFEFYWDFGKLAFIPMLVCIGLWRLCFNQCCRSDQNVWNVLLAYYTAFFAFCSFQNLALQSNMIFEVVMIVVFFNFLFKEIPYEDTSATVGV